MHTALLFSCCVNAIFLLSYILDSVAALQINTIKYRGCFSQTTFLNLQNLLSQKENSKIIEQQNSVVIVLFMYTSMRKVVWLKHTRYLIVFICKVTKDSRSFERRKTAFTQTIMQALELVENKQNCLFFLRLYWILFLKAAIKTSLLLLQNYSYVSAFKQKSLETVVRYLKCTFAQNIQGIFRNFGQN